MPLGNSLQSKSGNIYLMNGHNNQKELFEDVIKNEFPSILQLVKRNMDFELLGFRQTLLGTFDNFLPGAILDSDLCRVRLLWHPSDPRDGDYKKISFLYGRLHAPNDEKVIMWEGEKCYCWHDINLALHFLDGLSPEDFTSISSMPKIMKKYYQPNIREELNLKHISNVDIQPELVTRMHAEIWSQYGKRLFNLFDLRHSELWEQYKMFVQTFYSISPEVIKLSPPRHCIC